MNVYEKLQSVFIILAALSGLLLGHFEILAQLSKSLVLPSLILMLFIVFLNIPLRGMKKAFLNFKFTYLTLGMNFIWTPFLGWILGTYFLSAHPDLRIGFLMLLVTPCTDWYLVFTQLAGGSPTQATALLPWHLLLQLILLPLYIFIFAGMLLPVDVVLLIQSVSLVILLPFTSSFLLKSFIYKKMSVQWYQDVFLSRVSPFQFIFLLTAIMAMFCSQGEAIINDPPSTFLLFIPLIVFYISNLLIGFLLTKIANINIEDRRGFYFSTLARNSPLALVISITAFPEQPLISLSLVIGSLIELPLLALLANILRKINR